MRVNTRTGPDEAPFSGPAWWIAAAFLAIALLLQTQVMHYAAFRNAQPSLVLVVVVWYALHAGMRRAAAFGLIAGLCEDALATQTGGAWTISTTLTALFAAALSRWFFADSIAVMGGVAFAATLLRRMVFWIVMALEGYPAGYARLHFHQALWTALLNGALAIAAVAIERRIQQRAARKEQRASRKEQRAAR